LNQAFTPFDSAATNAFMIAAAPKVTTLPTTVTPTSTSSDAAAAPSTPVPLSPLSPSVSSNGWWPLWSASGPQRQLKPHHGAHLRKSLLQSLELMESLLFDDRSSPLYRARATPHSSTSNSPTGGDVAPVVSSSLSIDDGVLVDLPGSETITTTAAPIAIATPVVLATPVSDVDSLLDFMSAPSSAAATTATSSTPAVIATPLAATASTPPSSTTTAAAPPATPPLPNVRPLTVDESQLLTFLFAAATTLLPLPDKRQDLLRLILRYSDIVLSHPSCGQHTDIIIDGLRHTFTKRITSKSDKNLANVCYLFYLPSINLSWYFG
jgi:hypothetical protein